MATVKLHFLYYNTGSWLGTLYVRWPTMDMSDDNAQNSISPIPVCPNSLKRMIPPY